MRIAFVSTYPPTHCGVAEYTRMLISALKSVLSHIDIYVLCDVDGNEERFDGEAKAYVYPVFMRGSSKYGKILDVLSSIGGVDIIHVEHEYGIFGDTSAILDICVRAREEGLVKKVVFTMHTIHHPLSGRVGALDFQRKLDLADAVIVHSYLQEFEIQHQGVDPLKIYRIPHGTYMNPYLGIPRFRLMEELNLGKYSVKGIIAVVPGFLRMDKGLDILIEAIRLLNRGSDVTVIAAGEVRDKGVIDIIESARSRFNLVFIERYLSNEEMLKLIALADVVALPYRDKRGLYSVSGILHLSMGSFKPIIGTRAPRLIELYQFAPRLTVPPRNPSELAKKMNWLIENYDYAVAYMAYMYGYAVRTQWIRMARRHLSLYLNILKQQIKQQNKYFQ
ncbi:MAG: group 1 glycosyl transferase [Thermoprotei archaeon]|nr:MAG: group 1 glycosyl transferase [Thermoprotei archaeon]